MSSINWLSIKGIRSFGPDDKDKNQVKFGLPLTLLHGQNGAGKTTIIECLKFAITGETPPNSKGSFVHDPKLHGRRETQAEVVLSMNAANGEQYKVEINRTGTRSARGVSEKTTDILLEKIGDGQCRHLSSKSGAKNTAITEALGISEAVVNNVVLCHQEDANWPLTDTGTNLKEKFDKLFEISRYKEASKNIQIIQKEKKAVLDRRNERLQDLTKMCELATSKRKHLQEVENKMMTSQQNSEEIKKKLAELNTEIQKAELKLSDIRAVEEQVKKLQISLDQLNADKTSLEQEIRDDGIAVEMQQNLKLAIEKEKEVIDFSETTIKECEKKMIALNEENLTLSLKKASDNIIELTEENLDEMVATFEETLQKELQNITAIKEKRETEINEAEQKVIEAKTEMCALEMILEFLNKRIQAKCKARRDVEQELTTNNQSELANVEEKINSLRAKVEKAENNCSCLEDQIRLSESNNKSRDNKDLLKQLKNNLTIIQNTGKERGNLEVEKLSLESIKLLENFHSSSTTQLAEELEKLDEERNALCKLQSSIIKEQGEKNRLISEQFRLHVLESLSQHLNNEEEILREEHEAKVKERSKCTSTINQLRKKKEDIEKSNEVEITKAKTTRQNLERKLMEFAIINRRLENLQQESSNHKLEELCREIEKVESQVQDLSTDKEKRRGNISVAQSKLENLSELRKHETSFFLLEKKRKEITSKEDDLSKLQDDLKEKKRTNMERSYETLLEREKELSRDLFRGEGSDAETQRNICHLKEELHKLKDADEDYKKCFIDVVIHERAVKDLATYFDALNQAVLTYHKINLQQINSYIKQLWQETYCGKDIDYIELNCNTEDTGDINRMKYDYTVVMSFKGVKMNMRGRCSAGQKVLASLIIRMALAEVFCKDCGVLALDEPTANLDRANMESLADALIQIIESRSHQKNFQLVIITHDQRLVERIGRSSYVDNYFKISKDPQTARSSIKECAIQSLDI